MFSSWLLGGFAGLLRLFSVLGGIAGLFVGLGNNGWGLFLVCVVAFFFSGFLSYKSGHTVRIRN
jgi:hypothetical protein